MSIRSLALGLLAGSSSWAVIAENWRKKVSEIGVFVPWALSFQDGHRLAGIFSTESHFQSGGNPLSPLTSYPSLHSCLYAFWYSSGTPLFLVPGDLQCPLLASLYLISTFILYRASKLSLSERAFCFLVKPE